MAIIRKITNSVLEFYNGNWIIWKNHNKDFTKGSYYVLKNDGTVDYVEDNGINVKHINDIFIQKGDK